MFQKYACYLFCALLLFLSACGPALPDQMPDIGIDTDLLEFNTSISLTAPKELNTFKSGNEVCIDIKNLTEKTFDFSVLTLEFG